MVAKCTLVPNAVVVNERGQTLLARRSKNKAFPGLWGLPGGKAEVPDLGTTGDVLLACLQREILEEVGLVVDSRRYLHSAAREVGPGEWHVFVFFAVRHLGGAPIAGDGTSEVRWVYESELRDFDLVPGIKPAIEAAMRAARAEDLIGA